MPIVGRAMNLQVSDLEFHRQFWRFAEQVRRRSGGQSFTSFRDGLPAQWEDYKEDVRKEARRLLRVNQWKRADVGTGRILKQLIEAIEIDDADQELRNNTARYIEVKADRRSGQRLSFFLTAHEWKQSRSLPNYHFYLVLSAQ